MPKDTQAHATARAFLIAQRAVEDDHRLHAAMVERGRWRTVDLARRYGVTWVEIASILNSAPDAVRNRHTRGI